MGKSRSLPVQRHPLFYIDDGNVILRVRPLSILLYVALLRLIFLLGGLGRNTIQGSPIFFDARVRFLRAAPGEAQWAIGAGRRGIR